MVIWFLDFIFINGLIYGHTFSYKITKLTSSYKIINSISKLGNYKIDDKSDLIYIHVF